MTYAYVTTLNYLTSGSEMYFIIIVVDNELNYIVQRLRVIF